MEERVHPSGERTNEEQEGQDEKKVDLNRLFPGVAQKYFLLDDLLIVLVAPGKEILPEVQKYGPVSVVELEDAIQ